MYIAYPKAGKSPQQVAEALKALGEVAELVNVSQNVIVSALALKPEKAKATDTIDLDTLDKIHKARKAGNLTGTYQKISISSDVPTWGTAENLKAKPTKRGRKKAQIDKGLIDKVKALDAK